MVEYPDGEWLTKVQDYKDAITELTALYERALERNKIPISLPNVDTIKLSPGKHNQLHADIVHEFSERTRLTLHGKLKYGLQIIQTILFILTVTAFWDHIKRAANKKDTVRITLLRHGQPDFDWQKKIRGSDFRKIQRTYDAAGIIDTPPPSSRRLVFSHRVIASSTLPRSIQSAHALGARTIHLSSPIFREIHLPYLDQTSIRLPLRLWVTILRTLWLLGYSNNTESVAAARARAQAAANELITLAAEHKSVLLVGHGVLNHYIAKELLAANWTGPRNPGRKYWAFGTYGYSRVMTKLPFFELKLQQKAHQAAVALASEKSQKRT